MEVLHGDGVFCDAEFFVEGSWNGGFGADEFRSATVVSGSGCVIDEKIVFISSTDTLSRLHVAKNKNKIFVSNSLPFLLVAAELSIDHHYLFYQEDLSSVIMGLDLSVSDVPTVQGVDIQLYRHCNLIVNNDLRVSVEQKKVPNGFQCFDDYYRFLVLSLREIQENARNLMGVGGGDPIVTISKGYDSPTCAVLSKEIGCKEALSFTDPQSDDPDSDNGCEIADWLGLRSWIHTRSEYRQLGGEAEFLAVGTGGEDVFMGALEQHLPNRLLLTGFHGDKVWNRVNAQVSRNIVRGDPSGSDVEEFRLRVGFIHLAIPFFGCLRHPEIHNISNSNEMRPWVLGTKYDRPICRRIVESAGVPRELFGQDKRVMSRAFSDREDIDWYLGKDSLEDFQESASAMLRDYRGKGRYIFPHAIAASGKLLSDALGRITYRGSRVPLILTRPFGRYLDPLDERRFMFHWAIDKLIARYAKAVNAG